MSYSLWRLPTLAPGGACPSDPLATPLVVVVFYSNSCCCFSLFSTSSLSYSSFFSYSLSPIYSFPLSSSYLPLQFAPRCFLFLTILTNFLPFASLHQEPAASIWLEIWGVVDTGEKISIF